MQNSAIYKKRTEEKITDVLKNYYKPTGYNINVSFGSKNTAGADSILKK